jgi:hypothetical protein
MRYPRPLEGKITWLLADGSYVSQSDVAAVYRSADEIAFDCCDRSDPAYPISYTVTLHRRDKDFLEGNFQYMESGETISGPVRCRLYSNPNGFALIGTWIEEATRYDWFAELTPVAPK